MTNTSTLKDGFGRPIKMERINFDQIHHDRKMLSITLKQNQELREALITELTLAGKTVDEIREKYGHLMP